VRNEWRELTVTRNIFSAQAAARHFQFEVFMSIDLLDYRAELLTKALAPYGATLAQVRNAIEWADVEAAALACSPEECARIHAELDAWERTPLLSIAQHPEPIA
jgi:hypothetical protein